MGKKGVPVWMNSDKKNKQKFIFALFYFVFEGNLQVQAPGAYIRRGDLTEGFLRYEFGGLIFYCMYFRLFFCPKQGQGFKPSAAHLNPNIG